MTRHKKPIGWGIVGLLGATMMLANALITNGVETFVFLNDDPVSANPELFRLLFGLTRVLWTAEMIAWGVMILGFSVAGLFSSTLPKWLGAFGLLASTLLVLSSVFVVSVMSDGWAVTVIDLGALSGLAWFTCTGVFLLWKGSS